MIQIHTSSLEVVQQIVQLDEISITSTSQPGVYDCASLGQNAVNLVVTDVNGNTATAAATVTVEDNMAPTIGIIRRC